MKERQQITTATGKPNKQRPLPVAVVVSDVFAENGLNTFLEQECIKLIIDILGWLEIFIFHVFHFAEAIDIDFISSELASNENKMFKLEIRMRIALE